MAFDFGLISHAAQAKAVKLAPERIGNGTTDAGFAHPWGANQQQYRSIYRALE
jgi:hypothetical protein